MQKKQKENSKKGEKEIKKPRRLWRLKNIFVTILVVLFVIQYVQMQKLFADLYLLGNNDTSLITEIGQIKDSYVQIGQDLNEVREYLRLPTSSYGGFDEITDAADSDKNTDDVQLALFKYIEFLNTSGELEKNNSKYDEYLRSLGKSEAFVKYLASVGLTLGDIVEDENSESLLIIGPGGENVVVYFLDKELGVLYFKTIEEKVEVDSETAEAFVSELKTFLAKNKDELIKKVKNIEKKKSEISQAIAGAATTIENLQITLTDQYVDENLQLTYTVKNKLDEPIGEIVLDSTKQEISLRDLNNTDATVKATDITTALLPFLKKLDTRTFIEKKAAKANEDLKNTISDGGFQALLFESGLKISQEAREDEDRIYYDISTKSGAVVSSLVVEKATGVINIVQPDGTNSENLLFFDPEFKKKTLKLPDQIPDYGDEALSSKDSFNVLIAGKHGSLVDTMIFAHIDENKRTVRMISVPRDLFYNGRKINAYAHLYGMPELKKALSDITGYELDKYILIDMYAFIDVIDLIGGVDVHLTSSVIDPTYKTIDNGVVGTLHYEPGDYHLGGKEALRLARTRHTSSDFARAERQQMIIEAIQTKAQNFGFGDADTIYEIAKTTLSKTETDISLDEALAYYFRYQNYKIESNNVMSSGNVLYVPPYITTENCSELVAAAAAAGQPSPGCENENHAYTLLPRDNNWNVVKWFFRENFEGTGA